MSQSAEITARMIAHSQRVGGNPRMVPIAPFVLELEVADIFHNFCEALEDMRLATMTSRDKAFEILQHCPDVFDAYRTWCEMQGTE